MTATLREFFVTVDQDVLGRRHEAMDPESAMVAAIAAGEVPSGAEVTVRWDVLAGVEEGTWRFARVTSLRAPVTQTAAAATPSSTAPLPVAPAIPVMASGSPAVA